MIFRIFKKLSLFLLSILFCLCLLSLVSENMNSFVFSNDLEKKESELEEKKKEKEEALSQLEQVKNEISRIQNSGYSLDQQIRLIDVEVKRVEDEMKKVEDGIVEREGSIVLKEEDLNEKQEQVEKISEKLYKNSRMSFLEILFRQGGDDNFVQTLIFNRFVIASQISYMKEVAEEMRDLEEEKKELEKQKEDFEKDKEGFEESKGLLAKEKVRIQGELNKRVASQGALTRRIGGLEREISDLQNFLLLMKSGGTNVNVENLGTGDGPSSLPHFRANAPGSSFAVFSFGAYTHRNGMSQWGAWARSRAGQTYEQILNFYYSGLTLTTRENLMSKINVAGHGEMDFEEHYLLGIREINGAWNTQEDLNILKAQAIAARSYAVAYTSNGGNSICANERCQVYSNNHHGGAWAQAVEETRGMVLTNSGGNVVSTQYAAVHGGWVNNVGFDVRSNSGSWIDEAWDNISGVSWFYRNWHTKGYGTEVCSTHPDPWLTNAEMADIVNAYLYWSHDSVSSDPRLTAIDIATCWGKTANPYSMAELKEELKELGVSPVNSVSRVVTSNSNGWTTSIVFVTDVGSITVNNPTVFREVYNMRAPAFFSIPQNSFIHINIEMK